MQIKCLAICAALVSTMPVAALAQDSWTQFYGQQQQTLGNNLLNRNMMRQSQARSGGGQASAARARATCQNKGRAARNLGPDHPQVRELYRLCEAAGY